MHPKPYLCVSSAITNGSKINIYPKTHPHAYEPVSITPSLMNYGLDPFSNCSTHLPTTLSSRYKQRVKIRQITHLTKPLYMSGTGEN